MHVIAGKAAGFGEALTDDFLNNFLGNILFSGDFMESFSFLFSIRPKCLFIDFKKQLRNAYYRKS